MIETRQDKIKLLRKLGINVYTAREGVCYNPGQCIDENSKVIDTAASFITELMERYASLEGLVNRNIRTPQHATTQFLSSLSNCCDDVKKWGQRSSDPEVKYVSRTLSDVLTGELERTGYRSSAQVREPRYL